MIKATFEFAIYGLRFLLFTALIVAALYVSIGRIAVTAVGHFKEELTDILASSMGVEVSFDNIEGFWSYLDPAFTLENLVIGSTAEPAIVLRRVYFEFSTLLSLMKGTLVPTEIDIEGLRLALEQHSDGSWSVMGLPASDREFTYQLVLDATNHLDALTLRELHLLLAGGPNDLVIRSEDQLPIQITTYIGVRTLSIPLIIEQYSTDGNVEGTRIHLSGEYEGNLNNIEDVSANLYFNLPEIQLSEFLPDVKILDFELAAANVNGEMWLKYSHEKFSLTGRVSAHTVNLANEEGPFSFLDEIETQFELAGSIRDGGFQLFLPEINLKVGGQSIAISDVNLVAEVSGDSYIVGGNIPRLDLGEIRDSIISLNEKMSMITDKGLETLTSLNPRGLVEEITFLLDFSAESPDIKLTSNFRDAAIDAYLGVPAFSSLSGLLSYRPDRGYVDINNAAYDLYFASLFAKPWSLDSTRGRVNYRTRGDELQISSGLIELIDGELSAYGKVQVNLRPDRADDTWGLTIGINNADLLKANRYLPNTLSDDLLSWLNKSVLDGVGAQIALTFHGSLFRGSPKIRKVTEIFLRVEDGTLDYDENWPLISELDATVYINDRGVYSDDAVGKILNSRVTETVLSVPIPLIGMVDTLAIQVKVEGPLSDGILALNETPLADMTGHMAEQWRGAGQMKVDAVIEVPLGQRSGEDALTDITITLDGNDLTMPEFDLTLYSISGGINYKNSSGLTSEKFDAVLFNEKIQGSITSLVDEKSGVITAKLSGSVDMRDLYEWSGQVLFTATEGKLDYDSEIHVPFGETNDRTYVEVNSNLRGVTIKMPVPMKKESPDTELKLFYRQTFLDSKERIDLNLSNYIDGALQVENGIISGGQIHFGKGGLGAVSFDKLNVTGEIGAVNYEEWNSFIEGLDAASETSLESEIAQTLDDITIDVGLLDLYTLELPATKVRISRGDSAWRVELANKMLKAEVNVPDEEQLPLDLHLAYLRFFADDDETSIDEDPFSEIIPQEMPAVDFVIDELLIYGEDYGKWAFEFRPNKSGASFENLTAEVKGMSIVDPSHAYWFYSDGVHSSRYKGVSNTGDLGKVLEQWGYASSVEGSDFSFSSNLSWPGSPAMVALEKVKGTLRIRGGKGRFVHVDSGTAPLKLLGIFDPSQLTRRLRGDFSDVVEKGYSFSKIRGEVAFDAGIVRVTDTITIEGTGSRFKVGAEVNLVTSELSGDFVVTLPVGKNLPWYAAYSAIVTGPLVGAGVLLAQKMLEDEIDQMSSAKYKITGSIDNPTITFESLFDDSVWEAEVVEEKDVEVVEET